jgi:carbonic anhydrase/acetyltransferase-like protein (isoleucine patch superfamily)
MLYALEDHEPRSEGDVYVAPSASVIGQVLLGHESSVWFGCVLRGDNDRITLGAGTNIQDGAVLHVDPDVPLTLGRRVSVAHQVMLHGCTVHDESLIGMNAVVLNNAVIGRHCLVGANTLIPEGKEIPDGSLVLGSPGRVVRSLTAEDIEGIQYIADAYIKKAQRYREGVRALG